MCFFFFSLRRLGFERTGGEDFTSWDRETGNWVFGGRRGIGRTRSFRARGVSGRVLENGDLS